MKKFFTVVVITSCLALAMVALRSAAATEARAERVESEASGGDLVVALRAEPTTFNPLLAVDNPSRTIVRRLNADLVHINAGSQQTEPALAESWSVSADGRRIRLELRRGVRFSDGEPFDADDVLFTFAAYMDETLASPNRDLLTVGGKPMTVRKRGPYSVEIEMAEPYAVGERLFDSLAMLPEHRLGTALREGRLASVWGVGTATEEIVGLGPYRLARYRPGESLELVRNPHYWRSEDGDRRPRLERVKILFVASEDAQVIRFQGGVTHLIDDLSAASFELLDRRPEPRPYVLRDLGPGLSYEFLFFNQNNLGEQASPELSYKQREWFGKRAFRQAISVAIDRQAIVDLVYRGRATPIASHVTAGNKLWLNPSLAIPRHTPEEARKGLLRAGFTWDGKGRLVDRQKRLVELTLVTSASNSERVQIATLIQEDLRRLGLQVRLVPLEFRALLDRLFQTFDYEVCILGLGGGDVDPNGSMNVWRSSGGSHLWHLGQESPATDWEREIDQLLDRQLTERAFVERKRLYDRVQELVVEQLPFIFLISPNVLVGAHRDLGGFEPALLDHPTLWNIDELYWRKKAATDRF